jgi:outer membrane protein OmpA-like peptidoglycan-associated protein
VTVPAALLFTPGSARLQPGSEDLLRQVAADLVARPAWAATVTGHTAEYGTAESRLTLSRRRAEAVVTALTTLQVPASRLTAAGVGSREPAVPEFTGGRHDEAAAAKNRRVVIEMGAKGCGS